MSRNYNKGRQISPGKQYPEPSPGFIYIYTLNKFFNKRENNWFKVRNLPNTPPKHKDKWISYELRKSPYVFLKVGMTTQSVKKRIKQWEDKCHHDIMLINPHTDKVVYTNKLSHLFKRLAVKDKQKTYSSLTDEGAFYCSGNLAQAEGEIHKRLWSKYGKGSVSCKGCSDNSTRTNELFVNGFNIHVEWFLIPKKEISVVYDTVDGICTTYSQP
ncbi:hypothetical protein PSN45_001325 [Yamadazyma tenuis]|uniref:uncharacterized protein n=1 Tax=Candida tenuis TaxID=2315449 RepID=UPI00279A1B49|nr:hypothetical protein PSN45_001325 [Yamadazyma tenuis]